jgi:hypothetical protein
MGGVNRLIAAEVAAAESASDRSDESIPDYVRVTHGHDIARAVRSHSSEDDVLSGPRE